MVSGADHGCCCLALWDTDEWKLMKKLKMHAAALTCILDLEDGKHLLTGSYDKRVNLIEYGRG